MAVNKGVIKEEEKIRSLEGITLDEAMKLSEGIIKVGTAEGSRFVFCGDSRQYERERETLNKSLEYKTTSRYEGAKKNVMSGIKHSGASVEDYMKSLYNNSEKTCEDLYPTLEGYMEFLKSRLATLAGRSKRVREARIDAENYKPANERIVKQAYMATTQFDPPGTTIFIIEGKENSPAWTVEDYRNLVNEAEQDEDVIPFDSERYDEVFGDDK